MMKIHKSPLLNRWYVVGLSAALCVMLTGCLKSRLQIRDDEEQESPKPVPGKVEPVVPQGGYAVDELKSEINRLIGRVEELEHSKQETSASISREQKDSIKKLEARMTEFEQAQANIIDAIKKLQDSPHTAPAVSEVPENFEKGKKRFEAKDYDGAIESFSSYLKNTKAPKSEEATYFRGEAFYATKQYKKAIVDFSRFPEKYNHSRHMPTALLRIGQSFELLGMKDDAKGFYQELVEKFPKTPEAKKARSKVK